MIAPPISGIHFFWTTYDPLDLASGSIDVLGFMRGYIALADKILPGFTTITNWPRYVSMLCAAIARAQQAFPDSGESVVGLRQKRLAAVKSYERAWAFACGLAVANDEIGTEGVDGLRGIQYIRRRISELAGREKYVRTGSFNLLANQVRYGGIGAYSAMLEDCHLASMRSLSLRSLGAALADAFPRPPEELRAHDEDAPLSLDQLQEWGRVCHLAAFKDAEAFTLAEALRGGEEGGREDDVRWAMLRLLATYRDRDVADEAALFGGILVGIQSGSFGRLKLAGDCLNQIEAALPLIQTYETFYQATQFLFDAVRASATDEAEVRLEAVANQPQVQAACKGLRKVAPETSAALERAAVIHAQTAQDIQSVLTDAGILGLAKLVQAAKSDDTLLCVVLDRHRDVQHGKFDKGERKASWIHRDTASGKTRLSAQRYQIPVSGRWKRWNLVDWHPYRSFGALRFIRQCGIR